MSNLLPDQNEYSMRLQRALRRLVILLCVQCILICIWVGMIFYLVARHF